MTRSTAEILADARRRTKREIMSEHTKGPWRIHTSGSIYAGPLYLATTVGEAEQGEANARRIVACVNALEAFDQSGLDELLKQGGVGKIFDLAKSCAEERDRLAAFNRELVEALESITDSHEVLEHERGSMRATHTANARAVLAKVKP